MQERSKSVEVELESYANSPVFCTVKQKKSRDENKENFAVPRSRPKTKSNSSDTPRPKSSNRPASASRAPATPMSKLIKNTAPPPVFDGKSILVFLWIHC